MSHILAATLCRCGTTMTPHPIDPRYLICTHCDAVCPVGVAGGCKLCIASNRN